MLSRKGEVVDTIEQLEEIINAIIPTEWEAFESLGAKVEKTAAKLDAGRTTDNAQRGELRGVLKVKAGQTLAAGETLFTLPAALRPVAKRIIDAVSGLEATTSTGNKLIIEANGVVKVTVAVTEGQEVFLDGLIFAIS
jgi:hypothetical protein